jgi:hypothetical protein
MKTPSFCAFSMIEKFLFQATTLCEYTKSAMSTMNMSKNGVVFVHSTMSLIHKMTFILAQLQL